MQHREIHHRLRFRMHLKILAHFYDDIAWNSDLILVGRYSILNDENSA